MLNEGTSGKRAEKRLALPGGSSMTVGGVFALDLKAEQGFSGWREGRRAFQVSCQPQARRWRSQRPCTTFFLFVSFPLERNLGVCFTHVNHLLPGWSWGLEISTGGGSLCVALQNITHKAPPRMLTIQSTHSLTIHLPNGLEPLLCVS